ncbi:MAG TPA: hypothetical protein VIL09_09355 [Microvirga sp.]|jgi:4-coumarate--CoA ligase (photoactive yellow protein activation family)
MPLPRDAVAYALESKLRAEIASARRSTGGPALSPERWTDDTSLSDDGAPGTGSDSLERLWLAAAVNEMVHLDALGRHEELPALQRFGAWVDLAGEALARDGAQVTFVTSGSMGEPKRCTHALSDLDEEVRHLADLFVGRERIVGAVPAHHIYGFLFTVLLPARLERPVVTHAQAGSLRSRDLVVSFPDHWRFLERSLTAIPPDVEGVTSTAPCPRDLIAALVVKGFAGLTEVYGSSETAGIGTRRYPETHYRLMPHWRVDQAHPDDGTALLREDRRFALMDRIDWADATRFTVAGRRDEAVQVGGVNVYPERVARLLREHPAVAEAAVRLMRAEEGTRLKAFVVPKDQTADLPALDRDLRTWMAGVLSAPERPASLAFGPVLPRNPMGKLTDWDAGATG